MLKLVMIGAHAIPLPVESPYCLYEGDHWDNKRPFWDQVTSHPSCNGLNLTLRVWTLYKTCTYKSNNCK